MLEITDKTSKFELLPRTTESAPLSDQKSDALTVDKLERWLDEIRNQPRWRLIADKEDAYYDGNQIDAETMELLEERNQAPIIDNQIQPIINSVLGMQAKSRLDTRVAPEAGETNTEVAEALSVKLKHYGQMAGSQRAKSDAYASQVKTGVGIVEVARNSDPFKPPVRYDAVHRREIYWDWRARKSDLSDARYLVRRKWMDEDLLLLTFPEQRDFIKAALSGRANWDLELTGANIMTRGIDTDVSTGFTTSIEQYEWMNLTRKRLCVYEVWYRQFVRGQVVKLPNGRVVEFDETNDAHMAAVDAGLISPQVANFDKIRVAFWIGPQLVGDYPSPYKHRHFPYVLFFGYREDRTGIPYGLIRSMISPQDEINARKSKMLWLLSARRVKATEGAVADHAVAAEEVSRPDAYIIVSNKPGERFDVEENGPMATQQFQVMQEAKEAMQTAAGVHNAALGRESGATSGLAINSIVEQDSITLAEINDNFNMACRQADEILLSIVIEDLSDTEHESVIVEDDGGKKREIVLNQKTIDQETGLPVVLNDVTKVNVSCVLADTPQTPTFRNQQLNQMSELMKSLPPNIQSMLMPFVIESTDLPKRKEMSDVVRRGLGLGEDNQDPEKAQMQQQIQELQQKLDAKYPPEMLAKIVAETEKTKAETSAKKGETLYELGQTAQVYATVPGIAPIADSLAQAIGFEDANGYPLAPSPAQAISPVAMPTHTNPMTPAPPPSPGQGAMRGIETPRNDGSRL